MFTLALVVLIGSGTGDAQGPAATFDADYRKTHRGRITVEVPEVYELVNVAIAMTPTGRSSPNLVYQKSDYYGRMRAWFNKHVDHPLLTALDDAIRGSTSNYFRLKMNGYAFEFDPSGRIVPSRIYHRTGFTGDSLNALEPFVGQLQDFSTKSRFRPFYKANRETYETQSHFFRTEAGLSEMRAWLDRQFPGAAPYDAYKIIFSPLVNANQSMTWFESNGFRELQPHVNYPYPQELPRWGVGTLSPNAQSIFRGLIVFTEINHGYINAEAHKYRDRILAALGRRDHWVNPKFGPAYYQGIATFNEYMNWALISLWFTDRAPASDLDAMVSAIDRVMLNRGFPRFPAFNEYLLRIYGARTPSQPLADLYPRAVTWFEQDARGNQ